MCDILRMLQSVKHKAYRSRDFNRFSAKIAAPEVIRTSNPHASIAIRVDQLRIPVPAGIVASGYISIVSTWQEQRKPRNFDRSSISRLLHLVDIACEYPLLS